MNRFTDTVPSSINNHKSEEIKSVIYEYFNQYFKSYQTLEIVNFDYIVDNNESTLLYKKIHELSVESNKFVGLRYDKVNINLNYKNISYSENIANVTVLMNCDYSYSTTPGVKSTLKNIEYKFCLAYKNNTYRIISINSNFDEFSNFKKAVEQMIKFSPKRISRIDAISLIKEDRLKNIHNKIENINKNVKNQVEFIAMPKQIKPLTVGSTYSFNRMLAVNWAQRFATEDESKRFFYTAKNSDCTNFVSQCIWAGYGGYIEGDDAKTKSNISKKVRMVNNVWHAGTGGGMSNWESVSKLWNYVTTNTGNGPKATGLNNNQPYYNLSPSKIFYGNALQVRTGNSGDYGHSVFVTYSLDSSTEYYSQVLVSQHTYEKWNRNLWELITRWGENDCYLRCISFDSATFES